MSLVDNNTKILCRKCKKTFEIVGKDIQTCQKCSIRYFVGNCKEGKSGMKMIVELGEYLKEEKGIQNFILSYSTFATKVGEDNVEIEVKDKNKN